MALILSYADSMRFKFLLALLTFNFAFLTFALPVNAQQSNPYLAPNTNPDVPVNLNTWTQNVMISLMSAGVCQLTGINPADPNQACLGLDSTTGKIGFIKQELSPDGTPKVGGAIGLTGSWIAATFTHPPASTTEYLSYMGGKFGIVEPAYAQGTGFKGLSPLIKIWEAFRNLVYMLFVVVFVAIGLMIMLRVKIDPRTVMTIQNSIPKLIIALVLVTFSFAIAGFLIDLMYVVIFLIFGFFGGMGIPNLKDGLDAIQLAYQKENVFGAFNAIYSPTTAGTPVVGFFSGIGAVTKDVAGALKDSIAVSLGATPKGIDPLGTIGGAIVGAVAGVGGVVAMTTVFPAVIAIVVAAIIAGVVGATGGNLIQGKDFVEVVGGGAALIAVFVIFIALFVSLFKLLFTLLSAYIQILINVVFAPVWILAGAIPGSPISFSAWLRTIIANLSAFPATIFMFLLGKAFIEGFGGSASAASGGAFTAPLIGAQSIEALKAFIGLGIIFLTPQVVNIIKEALKTPTSKYGAAIGQAIGAGTGAPGGMMQQVSTLGSAAYYGKNLPVLGGAVKKMLGEKE